MTRSTLKTSCFWGKILDQILQKFHEIAQLEPIIFSNFIISRSQNLKTSYTFTNTGSSIDPQPIILPFPYRRYGYPGCK